MKRTKKFVSLLLVLCMVLSMIPAALAAGSLPFTDVNKLDWFYDAVEYVYEEGLMSGMEETTFSPNGTTTRGMIVTILHRLEGKPVVYGENFADVSADAYYADAVAWASDRGIVTGYGNGCFGPNDAITRQQLAAILFRYAGFYGKDTVPRALLGDFTDGDSVADYAVDAMQWAVATDLIKGSDGYLNPYGLATRAQVATILERFCNTGGSSFLPGFLIDSEGEEEDDGICTVTFNSNGGSEVESQEVEKGEYAELPPEPQKEGFLFVGWFLDENEHDWTKAFDFEKEAITRDIELNAVWVDTETDSDHDGLVDEIEDYIGTNKYSSDTDADGLNDYLEKVVLDYNPLNKDSDVDNVEDPDEDYDTDGLSNIEEVRLGTNTILLDTDLDGLSDGEEHAVYGTDPIKEDTDGDGASDGDEVRLGTDPLAANASFTETASTDYGVESQDVIVEVKTTVSGEQVGTLDITHVSGSENPSISPLIPGFIDYGVDITIEGSIDSAELVFKYDSAIGTLGADFQPRIYYFNEETKLFEELPNQTVTDGVVSTNISHFSTYILLNKVEFDKVWETEIKPPLSDGETGEEAALDIMFVIDYSSSMGWNDPKQLFKQLSKEFVEKLRDEKDKAGAVKFIKRATLVSGLTMDKAAIATAIDGISYDDGWGYYSGTDGSTGIKMALDELEKSESEYQYIVFITDGEDNGYTYSYDSLIEKAKQEAVTVYTVGMGSANESTLKKIAKETGGKYYHATTNVSSDDLVNLDEVFEDIEAETVDLTADLNDDKIPDYYNEMIRTGKLVLSNGSVEFVGRDFNYDENGDLCADFDGDGLLNGDELKIVTRGNRVYVNMISDPMMDDSDGDGYLDLKEIDRGTDPRVPTYPSDCVDWPMNDELWTHEYILKEQDSKDWARNLWSSVTFNWSHVDEAQDVLTNFFDMYSDLDSIENVQERIEKDVAGQVADSLIAGITNEIFTALETPGTALEVIQAGANAALAVKKWKNAGNIAANYVDTMHRINMHLGQFNRIYKPETIEIKGLSKYDTVVGGLKLVVGTAVDIGESIQAYSLLMATKAAFEESYDVLNTIAEQDDTQHGYVAKAAQEICDFLEQEENNYFNTSSRDFGYLIAENAASFAVTLLKGNPYVSAVSLLVNLLDTFTDTTKISEAGYRLFVIDGIVDATKELFTYSSKTGVFYDIEDEQTRHIELLICARMWGNDFAEIITTAQHYWGLFNDNKIREKYRNAIATENDLLENYLDYFV